MRGKARESRDYLGNVYASEAAMCNAYGIIPQTFRRRLKLGWSLEEALTGERKGERVWSDHEGRTFKLKSDMCNYYGVSIDKFNWRVRNGWSIRECLLGKEGGRE